MTVALGGELQADRTGGSATASSSLSTPADGGKALLAGSQQSTPERTVALTLFNVGSLAA